MIIFEITDERVSVLWGKKILNDLKVDGFYTKALENDSKEDITKTLEDILSDKVGKFSMPVAVCIPRSQITIRNLEFPAQNVRELDGIIDLHITEEVPYPREDIIYNYNVTGTTPTGFTEVLLCIIHRQKLLKIFTALEGCGIFPESFIFGSFGLLQFLLKSRSFKPDPNMLKAGLDVSGRHSNFVVFRGETIIFSKSLNLGVQDLEHEEKRMQLLSEIKQAMTIFPSIRRQQLDKIFITGISRGAYEINNFLNVSLGIPAETIESVNVLPALNDLEGIEKMTDESSITSMLGIAFDPLNTSNSFILPEAKTRKDMRDLTRNLVHTGVMLLCAIFLVLINFMGKIYIKQNYYEKISDMVIDLELSNRKQIEQMDKIKTIKKTTKFKDSFLHYYYELAKVVPGDITVERIIYVTDKEFSLVGRGTDMGAIFKFVRILNGQKTFGTVELRYSRKKAKGDDEFNEFDIMCHIG